MSFEERPRRDIWDAVNEAHAAGTDIGADGHLTLEHAENLCRATAIQLKGDPLVARFVKECTRRGVVIQVSKPWQALAEQKVKALCLASDLPLTILDHNGAAAGPERVVRARMVGLLSLSQTFLWKHEIAKLATSCPLPPHRVSAELLPYPYTFHAWEYPWSVPEPAETGYPAGVEVVSDCLAMGHSSDAVGVNLLYDLNPEPGPTVEVPPTWAFSGFRYGGMYPDDYAEHERLIMQNPLALLAFIRSPYTKLEAVKMPRQMRRHGDVSEADIDATVGVVVLRRAAKAAQAAYDAEPAAYKNRWWVSGHFRNQWYPSSSSHEVIWVAPYLKGPEGAPLLEKVYSVQR